MGKLSMTDTEPTNMTVPTFKLNTNASIPAIGLGTWQSKDSEVQKAVAYAIKSGYRHIDTAYCYGNEKEVGEGIRQGLAETGLQRSDIFITTKLWCTYHTRVQENLDRSLEDLGLEYVDLYLLHWPIAMNPSGNHEKFPTLPDGSRDLVRERSHVYTYKDMEKLLSMGKAKAIGVCNYSKRYLEELLGSTSIIPAVNQIENHPLLPQDEIVEACRKAGILVTAYSPLGSAGGPLLEDPRIKQLALEKKTTPACILVSYHIARGSAVLVKSITPSRIDENKNVIDLNGEDLKAIEQISRSNDPKRFVCPAFGVDFGFPDK